MQAITEDETEAPSPLPSFSNGKAKKNADAFPKKSFIPGKGVGEATVSSVLSPKIAITTELTHDPSPNSKQSSDLQAMSIPPPATAANLLTPTSALQPTSNVIGRRSSSLVTSPQQQQSHNPFAPSSAENSLKSPFSAGKLSMSALGKNSSLGSDTLAPDSSLKSPLRRSSTLVTSPQQQQPYNPFAPPSAENSLKSPFAPEKRSTNALGKGSEDSVSDSQGLSPFSGIRRGSSAGVPTFRRASIGAPGRRGSIMAGGQVRQMFDEDALKYFWTNRGLTQQDIDVAFDLLSQDGQKLTHADIKLFVSTYFDWFPEEAMTVLNSWKEEVTKTQLEEVLLGKQLMSSPYESAFKWFQPENGFLGKPQLKKIAKNFSRRKTPGKYDVKAILSKYDNDRDNLIGLEDFKKMGLY